MFVNNSLDESDFEERGQSRDSCRGFFGWEEKIEKREERVSIDRWSMIIVLVTSYRIRIGRKVFVSPVPRDETPGCPGGSDSCCTWECFVRFNHEPSFSSCLLAAPIQTGDILKQRVYQRHYRSECYCASEGKLNSEVWPILYEAYNAFRFANTRQSRWLTFRLVPFAIVNWLVDNAKPWEHLVTRFEEIRF